MAVNQTKISDDLKALVSAPDQSEFIFGFMAAYGLPKATITHIRQGESQPCQRIGPRWHQLKVLLSAGG